MGKKFSLDVPRIGYFLVYQSKKRSIFGKLIQKEQVKEGFSAEDSKYTHVEISGGGQWAISAQVPFSKIVDVRIRNKGRYAKVVAYKNKDYIDKGRYKVGWFGATKTNLPYGLWSLLWFKLNDFAFKKKNFLASSSSPFCSLLCAWALDQVYTEVFEDPKMIMPAHFVDKEKFEVIWEGIIE